LLHQVPDLMGQVRALTGRQMGGKRQDLTPGFAPSRSAGASASPADR
jgi:hypothetical protein